MEEVKVIKNLSRSYLAAIENSVGAKTWQSFYAKVNNEEQDVMRNGELSCAYFVSSILAIFGLIDRAHATVDTTVEKLPQHGWEQVETPHPGDILVWETVTFEDDEAYPHIGFFIGHNQAISNSYEKRVPQKHDWQFADTKPRKIVSVWHKALANT